MAITCGRQQCTVRVCVACKGQTCWVHFKNQQSLPVFARGPLFYYWLTCITARNVFQVTLCLWCASAFSCLTWWETRYKRYRSPFIKTLLYETTRGKKLHSYFRKNYSICFMGLLYTVQLIIRRIKTKKMYLLCQEVCSLMAKVLNLDFNLFSLDYKCR